MKKQESKPKINLILYFLVTYVYLELTFKIMIFGIANLFTLSFIYSTIFGGILSIIIVMICRLFHMKVSRKIALTINCLICVTYALQFFMKKIFNTFFSISLFGIADQAVSFTGTAIIEILKNLPFIIILFMPYIVMLFMRPKINFHHPLNKRLFITDGIFALFMIIIMIININIEKNNEN